MKKYKGYLIAAGILYIICAVTWFFNAYILKNLGNAMGFKVSLDYTIALILAVLCWGIMLLFPNYIQNRIDKYNENFLIYNSIVFIIIVILEFLSECIGGKTMFVGLGIVPIVLIVIALAIELFVAFSYKKDIKYNSENTSNNSDESDNNEDKKGN